MLKDTKGMTLVEMIVTVAVFSIATLILATGFATVIRYLGEATLIKNTGNEVFAMIESEDTKEVTNESVKLTITVENGSKIEDTITRKSVEKETDGEDSYKVRFTKLSKDEEYTNTSKSFYNLIQASLDYCLENSKTWVNTYNEKLIALKEQGVSGLDKYQPLTSSYFNNDRFIDYVFINDLEGKQYPELDTKIVEKCNEIFDKTSGIPSHKVINEVRISDKKMYMKCIYMPECSSFFLVADEYSNTPKVNNWKTRLIYNNDDGYWYYKIHYATDDNTSNYYFNVAGFTNEEQWNKLKADFLDNTKWRKIEID